MKMMHKKSKNVFLSLSLLAMMACQSETQPARAPEIARDVLGAVVNPTVSAQYPGIPTQTIIDCIMDHASGTEIVQIANAALLGSPTDSLYVILPIATRPDTISCIGSRTLTRF